MELIHLKTFKAVVDEAGTKGAAEQLNTVPSNITARLKKLEAELNTKLFSLVGRKLELTLSGEQLYPFATKMLQLESQAKTAIAQTQGRYAVSIGMPETFAAAHLPRALTLLKQQYPEIQPRIHTATSAELQLDVINNKIDCAIVGNARNHTNLHQMLVLDEELQYVTPKTGDYEPLLFVREEGCGYRQCAQAWQLETGKTDEAMMVMGSADGILGCISAGLGYTIISRDMVIGSRYEKALSLQPLTLGSSYIRFSMVYRKSSTQEGAVQNLAKLFMR